MQKIIKKFSDAEFVRYFLVCGACFLLDFSTLVILSELTPLHYLWANVIAFTTGNVANYILCTCYVFSYRRICHRGTEFSLFILTGILSLGVHQGSFWCMTQKMSIHYQLSKILATIVVFFFTFTVRKTLLFTRFKSPEDL